MSIIHVNQIKNQIVRLFTDQIDLNDVVNDKTSTHDTENFFLSRGLAAYAVHHLSGITVQDSALSITDGGDDNGIDALYYDEQNRKLYIVQSKWIRNGNGEPENGDIKKFVSGIHDLFNMEFDRFNLKLQSKKVAIARALADPLTKYEIIVAHTGSSTLAKHSSRDLSDLAEEMNDTSEVVFVSVLNQSALHTSLTAGIAGEPINLEIGLKSWGRKESPHDAYYGQLDANQIQVWWTKYRTRLFAHNLRSMLGDTEVNAEMKKTLENNSNNFFYFNNGITILARTVRKPMAGGGNNDFATFHCEDISIVNGAQTVGTIGKYSETGNKLENVYIPIRIIVRGEDENFASEVTKTNNRQNRIESRDFVALDPEQTRIRTELAIDGIDYQLMRSENIKSNDNSFDLVEASTALACASGTIHLPVQLKREIGKLWEDLSKAPYKELFNPSVPGIFIWRCVQIQRKIDKAINASARKSKRQKDVAVATHGNRLIAALVFEALPVKSFSEPEFDLEQINSKIIDENVTKILETLSDNVSTHYSNAVIPTLFKNLSKCENLAKQTRIKFKQ